MSVPRCSAILVVLLALCPLLKADMDVRQLTREKARQLGWKIETYKGDGYVGFAVRPPSKLLAENRSAHLGVYRGRKLIVSCPLGLNRLGDGARYQFAVSEEHLPDATFELSPASKLLGESTEGWRLRLSEFAVPNEEKKDRQ